MERTLVLVKPDAVQRGLVGEILSRLERTGLKLVAMKMLRMDRGMAERHYAVHRDQPFFEGLVQFIISGPLIAAIYEGPNAVEVMRSVMGVTDPTRADPGTIRADLAQDTRHNLVHGSDSVENAEMEISLFFNPEEVVG
ncbi:MAG TPA: nucleoside-diphosphate kinase [Dehalococcoidia bacterium]|nr:nucleoside-diphosphate kinase [Dehalococcoidia bacterium]